MNHVCTVLIWDMAIIIVGKNNIEAIEFLKYGGFLGRFWSGPSFFFLTSKNSGLIFISESSGNFTNFSFLAKF